MAMPITFHEQAILDSDMRRILADHNHPAFFNVFRPKLAKLLAESQGSESANVTTSHLYRHPNNPDLFVGSDVIDAILDAQASTIVAVDETSQVGMHTGAINAT